MGTMYIPLQILSGSSVFRIWLLLPSPSNHCGIRLSRLWPRKTTGAYPNSSLLHLNQNDISLSACQGNHANMEMGHSESTHLYAWNTDRLTCFKVDILNLNINECSVDYPVNVCWTSFAETQCYLCKVLWLNLKIQFKIIFQNSYSLQTHAVLWYLYEVI